MKEVRFLVEFNGVEGLTVEKPDMWLSEKYQIHRNFKLITRMKEDGINEHQLGVTSVENGYVYSDMFVQLTSVEDRGEYWYISFKPIGKDAGRCGFGCTRLYKNGIPEYGTISLEDITKTINVQTGEPK